MTLMKPKNVALFVGTDGLNVRAMFVCELFAGVTMAAMGALTQQYLAIVVGAVVILLCGFSAWKTKAVKAGEPLVLAGTAGFYISDCVGLPLSGEDYSAFEGAELTEDGAYLALRPRDISNFVAALDADLQQEAEDWIALTGSPVGIDLGRLGCMSDKPVTGGELCAILEDHIIYGRLAALSSEEPGISGMSWMGDGTALITAGEEAALSSDGICLRVKGQQAVWCFPYAELLGVAGAEDTQGSQREVLMLLIFPKAIVMLGEQDKIFPAVYDRITELDGFDREKFLHAAHEGRGQPVPCWRRPSCHRGAQ